MRWSMLGLSMVAAALLLPQCSLFQTQQADPGVQEQVFPVVHSAPRSNELDPGTFEFVGTTSTYLDGATVLTAIDSGQGWIVGGPMGAMQKVGGAGAPTMEAAVVLSGYPIRTRFVVRAQLFPKAFHCCRDVNEHRHVFRQIRQIGFD